MKNSFVKNSVTIKKFRNDSDGNFLSRSAFLLCVDTIFLVEERKKKQSHKYLHNVANVINTQLCNRKIKIDIIISYEEINFQ
jgi:hypothetical protein